MVITGQQQLQWQRGKGNGATETAMIDRSQLQWHRGRGTGATATAMAMGQQGVGGNVYVVLQCKTSTVVVDETVQNVWTAKHA
jgi:hypothetical protein